MPQEKFHYKSLEEVKQRAAELGVDLPFAADTHALAQPLTVRNITFPNRLGIAPMEGADSTPEGAPTEYTTRRYVNEAIGGSSVIWFEAISIVEEGRSIVLYNSFPSGVSFKIGSISNCCAQRPICWVKSSWQRCS